MTLSKEIRYQAVRRILRGEESRKQVIARLSKPGAKVTERMIKNWITRFKNEKQKVPVTPKRVVSVPPQTPSDTPTEPAASDTSNDYDRALRAAGIASGGDIPPDSPTGTDDVLGGDVEIPEIPEDGPDVEKKETEADPITPEQLIALSETLVVMPTQLYASARGVSIPEEVLGFSAQERSTLSVFAPFACQYSPALMSKMPGVMAAGFLVILGMSMVSRFGMVKAAVAAKAEAEMKSPESEIRSPVAIAAEKPVLDVNGFPIG